MKILWSNRALTDLREIRDWIAADSPTYALRMMERIVRQTELLATMPRRGHAVPEAQNADFFEVHAEPYRIIYKVSAETVGILTLVHMARQIGSFVGDENV